MKFTTKEIAITALFVAIVAVMTLVPFLGMIPLVVISVNIVLIPIMVCAQTTNTKIAVIVSTAFGIFSLINSYLRPTTLLAFAVQNPLVSILPRIFIGLTASLTYKGLMKLQKNSNSERNEGDEEIEFGNFGSRYKKNALASTISAIVGVVTNTVLFFLMLLLCYGGAELSNGGTIGLPLMGGILVSNFIPEVIAAAILVPLITSALKKALKA